MSTAAAAPVLPGLMDPRETSHFLRRLCSDDSFRQRLQEHPEQVLREYRIPARDVPVSVTLPTKAEARQALADGIVTGALPDPRNTSLPLVIGC